MQILANFSVALQCKLSHSVFLLSLIYLEHMPKLFDFAASYL